MGEHGQFPTGSYGAPGGQDQPGGYGAEDPGAASGIPGGSYGGPGMSGPGGYGGYAPPPRRRRRGAFLALAGVAVLAAGIGAGATVLLNSTGTPSSTGVSSRDVPSSHNNTAGSSTQLNQQAVASKVEPGVVDITSRLAFDSAIGAEGTGMVINSDGLVLTNNHVIDGAAKITATLVTTGKTYTARVVGYDAADDVALLQLEGASGLKTVQMGNSSQVTLGTQVLAIGNAEGQGGQPTAAQGVIDATNRTITASSEDGSMPPETLHGMLQTTADVVSGDSGGPLANAAGQVIGMDTASVTGSNGSSAVYGYAIPINRALSIARQIAAGHGSSAIQIGLPGFMGVSVTDVSQAAACMSSRGSGSGSGGLGYGGPAYGNGSGYNAPVSSGALICQVYSGTPAASSGLSAGDVITAVSGTPVSSANSLTTVMSKYRPGQTISVSYVTANGTKGTASLKLVAGPPR